MRNRREGRKPRRTKKFTHSGPITIHEYFAMSARAQDEWNEIVRTISKMENEGLSLPAASREFGLNPRKVIQLGHAALRKRANGRYMVKNGYRLLRVLVIPAPGGLREIAVLDSKEASLIGKYWAAVHNYLETGDASALRKIRRKTVTDADGKRIRLIKDLAELDRLGSAGVLSFESLYAKAA